MSAQPTGGVEMRFKLTVTVDYDPATTYEHEARHALRHAAQYLANNGLLSSPEGVVDGWRYDVEHVGGGGEQPEPAEASEHQTSLAERLALIGKFASEDRARNLQPKSTLRRLSELGQFGPRDRRRLPYEQMKKHPHRFDGSLWEQTIKNVRDGLPAGSTERAVMEDWSEDEMSKRELAQKHGLSPSALSKLLHQIRELNRAEYNRLSNQQEEQHGE